MYSPSEISGVQTKPNQAAPTGQDWVSKAKNSTHITHRSVATARTVFLHYRWAFIAALGVGIPLIEIAEFLDSSATHPSGISERTELILFLLLAALFGVFLELMVWSLKKTSDISKILVQKHSLSLLLSQNLDFEELVSRIVDFPRTAANIIATSVWIYDSVGDRFMRISKASPEETNMIQAVFTLGENFNKTTLGDSGGLFPLDTGQYSKSTPLSERLYVYCLPLRIGEALIGMLLLATAPGKKILSRQAEIFNHANFEIALALKTGHQRKLLVETRIKEAVISERKNVSKDLHDRLGQNLNYLRLKLDLMSSGEEPVKGREVRQTLMQMRNVADEACDQIHLILTDLYHDTQIGLEQAIRQYAERISERSNFKIYIENDGTPVPLLPQVSQNILYIFHEAINNIEKHSHAKCVCLEMRWGEGDLTLVIIDDGVGIDYEKRINATGLGMRFMSECAHKINGLLELNSIPMRGTSMSLWVPLPRVE